MDTSEPQPTAAPPTTAPPTTAPLHGEPLPVELMNTVWAGRDGVHDALGDTADLAAWLRAVEPRLPDGLGARSEAGTGDQAGTGRRARPSPGRPDALSASAGLPGLLAEFRRLRDALRRLAAEATADDRPAAHAANGRLDLPAAVAHLNEACGFAPASSYLVWSPDGGGAALRGLHSPYPAAAAALSVVAEQGVALFAGEGRAQLGACHAPGCVLYFLRTPPRRAWCSAACGNRARVARHYHRHHDPRPHGR
ncbi:CGNR zinc finger domain-containing protein [Streptomyces sp. V4-01]|uniref:CGNR zinc finger domain-containing protein n=1 Tax=Actinacidiphila polyblastidii TaxID=3110430 RepID=A0ABU7PL71_9ACTN|nr:CGNR zinc finger domain-containing protein [Streptomyces sp. V4-01]